MIRTKFTILIFLTIFISCGEKETQMEIQKSQLLDGLYVGKSLNEESNIKFIWIFSNNTVFKLFKPYSHYADDNLGIDYHSPSIFYLEQNLLFMCSPHANDIPFTLAECRNKKYAHLYEIIKIDTLFDGHRTEQVIQLAENFSDSKYEIRKSIHDTIKREINVETQGLFDFINKNKTDNTQKK